MCHKYIKPVIDVFPYLQTYKSHFISTYSKDHTHNLKICRHRLSTVYLPYFYFRSTLRGDIKIGPLKQGLNKFLYIITTHPS